MICTNGSSCLATVVRREFTREMTQKMWREKCIILTLLARLPCSLAIDNGRGLKPPMGWRSWNLFGADVSQSLMMQIMDGMVSKNRTVDGVPTSLCDLGYCDVGLDDNWQLCGSYGPQNYTYHDENGAPVINTTSFPDMKQMVDYAHELGLTAGWYGNNCICRDHCGSDRQHNEDDDTCYKGDVDALVGFGFDGVKLDNCGAQKDLELWADLINATDHAVTIENCHWGHTVPHIAFPNQEPDHDNGVWCPWNFYRTSKDVRARYSSIIHNLETTVPFATRNLSFPGCWAYPDMLEVGCEHGPGGAQDPGLTPEETRSHFASWCVVSSPLTLSHDVTNATVMDAVWPIIANPEAIAVNQAWAGHSGSPFKRSLESVHLKHREGKKVIAFETAAWQYFYKPLVLDSASGRATKVAVVLMNQSPDAATLSFTFDDVPNLAPCPATGCQVRDVWTRADLGDFVDSYATAAPLAGHDAAFLTITT